MAQKHFSFLPKQPPAKNGKRLLGTLVLAGRRIRCEAPGCGCQAADEIEIHHIMPLVTRRDHSHANLAVLCKNHHALVERFYWAERCKQSPELTQELGALMAKFKADTRERAGRDEVACARARELWDALNTLPTAQDPTWWKRLYRQALAWAATQEVVRYVHAGDAITEDPWYRAKATA